MRQSVKLAFACAIAGALNTGMAHASCGSAFCVLNTNWAIQGAANEPGTARLDLRYEFVDQTHLRSGNRQISAAEDTGEETELRTINRNLLATFDYALSQKWSVSASAPVISRSHSHVSEPTAAATLESWNFTELGDARILGHYHVVSPDPRKGCTLSVGLKLPTGSYRVENNDGTSAERALQPGSGSTDLLFGAYWSGPAWRADSSWFAQGLVQQALATKDGYRPGAQFQLNLGYRHPVGDSLQALAQINMLIKARDAGVNAEPDLSGSRNLFFTPGLSYALTRDMQLYGFVQLPVYRYVNGTQLSADWSLIAGMTMRF